MLTKSSMAGTSACVVVSYSGANIFITLGIRALRREKFCLSYAVPSYRVFGRPGTAINTPAWLVAHAVNQAVKLWIGCLRRITQYWRSHHIGARSYLPGRSRKPGTWRYPRTQQQDYQYLIQVYILVIDLQSLLEPRNDLNTILTLLTSQQLSPGSRWFRFCLMCFSVPPVP